MKKLLLIIASIVLFSGCVKNQPKPKLTQTQIEQYIIGTWHLIDKKVAKDGTVISVDEKDRYFKNGLLKIKQHVYFRDKNGKLLGALLLKQDRSYKIYNNKLATMFISCKTKILKRPKSIRVDFVSDVFKIGCKYANKLFAKKRSTYVEIDYIDNRVMRIKNIKLVKVK